ncbi:hypothetical protein ACPWT1_17000 [Ramlibacter sp. MMS24-I3-19]|uniref:hypothetical protein n=1 Tax=Ramlibacter sp. MMS24-I3-19 TaxID=3416606 RepID=UPI003CFD29EB
MQDQTRDRQDKEQERTAPAAEADVLGEAARNTGTMDGLAPQRDDNAQAERGQAQPGKDENQAGFVKDPDKKFSP